MIKFWGSLSQAAKISFIGGLVLILGVTALAGFSLLRVDYQVLFSDLKPQDSSVMIEELERLKIPYKISDAGDAILVAKESVHATRFKLLGKDLPLHGVVGLELFNNSDFGMTEFAQKINYQRALQGEITRTISSLEEVQDVRVHLALPEEGLFKRATSKAKAAITIALKPGLSLRPEQVSGIQRLVAAAVQGISAQDVTIVDKKGIALSRLSSQAEREFDSHSLELKKETEALLSKKVNQLLTNTFGENQASASVDVVLNMDQIKITMDDVLSVPTSVGQTPTGVIVKDKETSRDITPPLSTSVENQQSKSGAFSREVEYQVGRRSEQIISQPGAIRRVSAVAVIHKELTDVQKEQIKSLVSGAVGANLDRGDTVIIQSGAELNQIKNPTSISQIAKELSDPEVPVRENRNLNRFSEPSTQVLLILVALGTLLIIILSVLLVKSRSENVKSRMGPEEREQALLQLQQWLSKESLSETAAQNRGMQ